MSQLDKPNLIVPLALSYNQRGIDGALSIANALDQRKVNCMYEIGENAVTGKRTPTLVKRPGLSASSAFNGPGASATTRLVSNIPNGAVGAAWIIYRTGTNPRSIRVADTAGNTEIYTDAAGGNDQDAEYIQLTSVSGTEYAVLQGGGKTGAGQQVVYYSSTRATWTQISDADFTGLSMTGMMAFLGGYAFILTSNTNRIHSSDLNSLANWTADNYVTMSTSGDPGVGLARAGQLIVAFGHENMEVFYNAGNASGSPLSPLPQLTQRIGLPDTTVLDRHYYCADGQRIYFIGHSGGYIYEMGIYTFAGGAVEKVSTPYIDKILSGSTGVSIWKTTVSGQVAISVGFSGEAGAAVWLMYFPAYREWFEWTSEFYKPVTNGTFFLGTGNTDAANTLGYVKTDADSYADAGASTTSNPTTTVQFRLPRGGPDRKRMYMAGLIGDTARSASTVGMSFSDDDGQNWSTARDIDMTQVTKKNIYRCGSYSERMVRLTHTGNVPLRLEQFIARIED